MLLYKKERQQYHEVVTDNISPSTIYGAEHLLRLFGNYLFLAYELRSWKLLGIGIIYVFVNFTHNLFAVSGVLLSYVQVFFVV